MAVERVNGDGSLIRKKRKRKGPGKPSPKQQNFIEVYLELVETGVDQEEAADEAAVLTGYNKGSGTALLANPRVGQAIQAGRKDMSIATMREICTVTPMNRAERRSLLAEIAIGKASYKTTDRLKAIEMDAKISGDYVEHKRVDHLVLQKRVEDMTNEELAKIVAGKDLEEEEP